MKKLMLAAVIVGALTLALASTAFAQGPVQGQGTPAPGAGLMQPGARYGRGMAMRGGGPAWAGQPEEVQALLGMTEEEIQAERLAGKSLVQIAAAKGISEAQLTNTILGAKKADLDKLVADGALTQAQADAMYARMQAQVPQMINRTTTGPGWAPGSGANAGAGTPTQCLGAGAGMGRMGRWNR